LILFQCAKTCQKRAKNHVKPSEKLTRRQNSHIPFDLNRLQMIVGIKTCFYVGIHYILDFFLPANQK